MTRINQLRRRLHEAGVDGMLVTKPENVRYLSGFTGTFGTLLVASAAAFLFTDSRYMEQAARECSDWTVVQTKESLAQTVGSVLSTLAVKKLALESSHITLAEMEDYRAWECDAPRLQLMPMKSLVEDLRLFKDAAEIDSIIRAAEIADKTFAHMLSILRPGITELQAAAELEYFMRQQGASGPAFATIVASGWRSALPHGVASEKVLEHGDFVTMDFGAVYNGYVSDLTRTVCLGTPSAEQRRIYEIVRSAQAQSLEAARPGLPARELDAVARTWIATHGYKDAFGHGLGHGIGLEIHEAPRINAQSEDHLVPGMVITIEPGIYVPGLGGVRIEDDVYLSNDSHRVLTHAQKELICL